MIAEFGSPHTVSSMEEITMKEVSEQRGLFETEVCIPLLYRIAGEGNGNPLF